MVPFLEKTGSGTLMDGVLIDFGSTKKSKSVLEEGNSPPPVRFIYLLLPPEETNRIIERNGPPFCKWKKGRRWPHSCIQLAKLLNERFSPPSQFCERDLEGHMGLSPSFLKEQPPLHLAYVIVVLCFRSRTTEKTAMI